MHGLKHPFAIPYLQASYANILQIMNASVAPES